MCRLTAYLGEPLGLATCMFGGSHSLYRQSWEPRELLHGRVNADGWGVAWYGNEGPVRLARPEPVWYDPNLADVLSGMTSWAIMAALRNATIGLPIGPVAVPPLTHARWTFALNGFVPDFRRQYMRRLRQPLPDHLYGELAGVSDTETVFLLTIERLERGASPAEALGGVVEWVLSQVSDEHECQLTAILTDGKALAYVRASNRAEANSLYRIDGGRLAPGGTMLASEALDDHPGWAPVPLRVVGEVTQPQGPVVEIPLG